MTKGTAFRAALARAVDMKSCAKGSNAVEFALVSPVLLFLMLGTLYAGLYLGMVHSVQRASFEAARYAAVGVDAAERTDLVKRWIEREIGGYAILKADRLVYAAEESGGRFAVRISYDASYLPFPSFVKQVLVFDGTIVRVSPVTLP